MTKSPKPGVSRDERISDEGLLRLEKQLKTNSGISGVVLTQWIRRYGDAAREIIREQGRYIEAFDQTN